MESRVVGILIYAIPRLKVAAAKPPRSVTMPPPKFINSEWRVAPCSLRACHTEARVSRFLCTSSAPIMISVASCIAGIFCSCGKQRRWVCSSVRIKACHEDTFRWLLPGCFPDSHKELLLVYSFGQLQIISYKLLKGRGLPLFIVLQR